MYTAIPDRYTENPWISDFLKLLLQLPGTVLVQHVCSDSLRGCDSEALLRERRPCLSSPEFVDPAIHNEVNN